MFNTTEKYVTINKRVKKRYKILCSYLYGIFYQHYYDFFSKVFPFFFLVLSLWHTNKHARRQTVGEITVSYYLNTVVCWKGQPSSCIVSRIDNRTCTFTSVQGLLFSIVKNKQLWLVFKTNVYTIRIDIACLFAKEEYQYLYETNLFAYSCSLSIAFLLFFSFFSMTYQTISIT